MFVTWDEAKRVTNLEKHGLDFADIDTEFFATAIVEPARAPRLRALERLKGELVVLLIFAPLGIEAIAFISLRPANKRERMRLYAS